MSLSQDGRYVVYSRPLKENDELSGLFLLATDGSGEEVPLEGYLNSSDNYAPVWAPDGRNIVFVSNSGPVGTRSLCLTQVIDGKQVGEPQFVMRSAGRIGPLGFTRKGSLYYQVYCEDPNSDIYVTSLDMETGELISQPTRLPSEGSNCAPSWSPDGKKLAFVSRRPSPKGAGYAFRTLLVIRSMESGEEREILPEKSLCTDYNEFPLGYLRWSPDGRSILCGGFDRLGIHLIDIQTGDITTVVEEHPKIRYWGLAWSLDGKTIFYIRYREEKGEQPYSIMAHDLATGEERELYPGGNDWEYGLHIFEKDHEGNFVTRKSRGHLNTRHCLINSIPLMDTLRKKARKLGIELFERTMVNELVIDDGLAVGALGFNYRKGEISSFKSKAIVAAAGGGSFRGTFLATKNLSGDILAAAYRAGAVLKGFENTVSNTVARDFSIHGLNLIVGSGGRFLNAKGEEFMWQYHPTLGNRARQQDLVIAFCQEAKEGRGPIYLDMSAASSQDQELMRKILPHSFRTWDRSGLDFFKDKISWVPAFEGTMTVGGGIHIDRGCRSNIHGLFAAGDATNLPHHGTYSVGGLCISFAYLSGCLAGANAASFTIQNDYKNWAGAVVKQQTHDYINGLLFHLDKAEGISTDQVIRDIQDVIIPWGVGYIRSEGRLLEALGKIEQIRDEKIPQLKALDLHDLVKVQEAKSLVLQAELIVRSALMRKESRGFHFREDYPYTDNKNWLKWIFIQKKDGKPYLWTDNVPTPYYAPSEHFSIPPGLKR